ncbi:MAG: MBL fold metallo-hydrolase [Pseudomonadota bacterium]
MSVGKSAERRNGALSRRGFLTAAAAAPVLGAPLLGPGALSAASFGAPVSGQNAGWSRFQLGAFEITIVSDGNLTIPTDGLGANAPREAVTAFLAERFLDTETLYSHTNHVVIDTGAARVLVDVGSGDKFQTSAGRLVANLEAAQIDPASITHVALTHAHPDHVWGMMDDFGDDLRFAEAAYAINAAEFDWWMAEGRAEEVPAEMQGFVIGATNALGPIAERASMVADGAEIVSGVRMIATHGHTLGHMSVLVESEGEALLVAGDALNHAYVAFERPDWHTGFDMDKEQAVATRKRLLDMAATDRIAVAAYHFPFPGVGHVARSGEAYRFIPAQWRWGG